MFERQAGWLDRPCHYVMAHDGFRRAWPAGPYRTAAEAQAVLPEATEWAPRDSGDEGADRYAYAVYEHHDGWTRSVLGEVGP